ncbi:hypothetical protein NQ317_014773, partial [Molorchus minor]
VPSIIRIINHMVGVENGSTAVLECEVEAFPDPVRADSCWFTYGSKTPEGTGAVKYTRLQPSDTDIRKLGDQCDCILGKKFMQLNCA